MSFQASFFNSPTTNHKVGLAFLQVLGCKWFLRYFCYQIQHLINQKNMPTTYEKYISKKSFPNKQKTSTAMN
jgi:hypothetical protein